MKKLILLLVAFSLLLTGCGGLNYNQVAPNAGSFHPKVVVVLPVKMPEGWEANSEKISGILTDEITNGKRFGQIIDPATARTQMAAPENKGLSDSVTAYLSKFFITGVSDKTLSQKIGEAYHSDTIIVPEVSRYGYINVAGGKFGEVGFSIKVIDAETGTVIWKAGHTEQEKYLLFKPDLDKMVRNLMKKILEYSPIS